MLCWGELSGGTVWLEEASGLWYKHVRFERRAAMPWGAGRGLGGGGQAAHQR